MLHFSLGFISFSVAPYIKNLIVFVECKKKKKSIVLCNKITTVWTLSSVEEYRNTELNTFKMNPESSCMVSIDIDENKEHFLDIYSELVW